MFESVGLIARFDKREAINLVERLFEYLTNKGVEVYIEKTLIDEMETEQEGGPLAKMTPDFLITVGGTEQF